MKKADFGNQHGRETTERAGCLGINMQGDKGRETNEEAVILGTSMQGDM